MAELQDAIDKIKTNYDSMQSAMAAAAAQLERTKAESRDWDAKVAAAKQEHGRLISELEAKRVAAERESEEAGKRIALNNAQVAELTRIRSELDKREKELARREQAVENGLAQVAAQSTLVQSRFDDVERKEAEINKRYAKMKEAMS